MREMQLKPYWRRYACPSLTPAILATAYHSLVGSSAPVSNASSAIGWVASRG